MASSCCGGLRAPAAPLRRLYRPLVSEGDAAYRAALVELRLNHCTNVHGRHFRRVLGGLAKARESGLTDVILDSNQLDDNDVVELASSLGGESWHANDHPRPPSEQKAEEEGEVEGEGDFDDFEVGGEDPSRHHGPVS